MAGQTISQKPTNNTGFYVALFRRTEAGAPMFSDPIYVSDDSKKLPDLPVGLQYIIVHPSETAIEPRTMQGFTPSSKIAHKYKTQQLHIQEIQQKRDRMSLPTEDDYGLYSSFLPTRDSTLSSLAPVDYTTVLDCSQAEKQHNLAKEKSHDDGVTDTEVGLALELAHKVLADDDSMDVVETNGEVLTDSVIEELGLKPAPTVDMDRDSILEQNNKLLLQLLEMQERRAQSGKDFGNISDEERATATRLQNNLVKAAASVPPSSLLHPLTDTEDGSHQHLAIKRAAQLLLAKNNAEHSVAHRGNLPANRRFGFLSNASTNAGFPQLATMAPMQRRAPNPSSQQPATST